MPELAPQQRVGPYTIIRKLAEGGMAEIYLAARAGPSGFSKLCVLKRIREEFRTNPRFRSLFENEARTAARLEHANIVQIFDLYAAEDQELFLAMQWVDGCSLSVLRKHAPREMLPARLAAFVVREVAAALSYAQRVAGDDGKPMKLMHRDISPQNILVSRIGEVKLTDFGIARPVDTQTSGGFKGKIAYMAPEQARVEPVDVRTDLFALGIVLFELSTGARPFEVASEVAHIRDMSVGTEPAPRADRMGVEVPGAIVDIIEGLLRRRQAERTATPEELCRQLDAFIHLQEGDPKAELAAFLAEHTDLPPAVVTPVPTLDSKDFEIVEEGGEARSRADTRRYGPSAAPSRATPMPVGVRRGLLGAAVLGLSIGTVAIPLLLRAKSVHTAEPPPPAPGLQPHAPPATPLAAAPIPAVATAAPSPSTPPPSPPPGSASSAIPQGLEASPPRPSPRAEPAIKERDEAPARSSSKIAASGAALPSRFTPPGGAGTGPSGVRRAPQAVEPKLVAGAQISGGPPVQVEIGVSGTTPFASFVVDGAKEGETPASLPLAPGKHEIVFTYAGREQRRTFVVRPGEHPRVEADFSR